MSDKNIFIRTLKTIDELEELRRLESLIWSEYESIPSSQTITAIKNGGMALGAFLEEELIGFQYSFPGFINNKIYLCSHTLGIHPEYRKLGIGEKLKLAQKEESLKMGYDLITWTYDPLETVNGYLNLHKLGAKCSIYVENCYGEMQDELNQGMPSDRFTVDWWIKEASVERPSQYEVDGRLLIWLDRDLNGNFVPLEPVLNQDSSKGFLFVPVPSDFQIIKKINPDLALSWRRCTREVFVHYFEKGWSAIDLFRSKSNPELCYYVLKKL
ncbi:GNAT family N-acetyltransferase [Bacillus xiapuensis]|uniref:GNAT family N-acetyltransferase n=1 Tax=Bacillus xiapuensis TaxID=2014075 RepID=A0ABU6N9J9_9BACI|nr:GNAT family N-acetyltransferase [Bacillus xiapuensis]